MLTLHDEQRICFLVYFIIESRDSCFAVDGGTWKVDGRAQALVDPGLATPLHAMINHFLQFKEVRNYHAPNLCSFLHQHVCQNQGLSFINQLCNQLCLFRIASYRMLLVSLFFITVINLYSFSNSKFLFKYYMYMHICIILRRRITVNNSAILFIQHCEV